MQSFTSVFIGNGEYRCAYGLEQYKELERLCNAGVGEIYARTSKGRYGFLDGEIYPELAEYRVLELREVVRQGLIGGGAAVIDGAEIKIADFRVDEILSTYFFGLSDQRLGLTKLWAAAYRILHDLTHGYSPPKKAEPVASPATPKKGSTTRRRSRTAP